MHLKMSSGKWRPFCLGLNVLKPILLSTYRIRNVCECQIQHEAGTLADGNLVGAAEAHSSGRGWGLEDVNSAPFITMTS